MARLRSAEAIPADNRMRRKLEWEDTRRPAWVMWLSVLCLLVLVVSVFALANSVRMSRPMAINGDTLGPETSESVDDYVRRAAASIADASDDQPRWAMVSPDAPADVPTLSAIFADHPALRVSTLLAGGAQWPVPEPAIGHRREDVFAAVRDRILATSLFPGGAEDIGITGIIVRGTPEELAAVADTPGVKAVEALPPDAVYGRFGMRPMDSVYGAGEEAAPENPPVPGVDGGLTDGISGGNAVDPRAVAEP